VGTELGGLGSGSSRTRVSRLEAALLLALIFLGFALRVYGLSSIGLNHFDEGVYAYSAYSIVKPGGPYFLYRGQKLISPPFFFVLIALSYFVSGGPSDTAAFFLNVLLGTLSIVLIWWAGRRWFGPAAGVVAAVLLTFNGLHTALSRTALTDVAFALLFLLALTLITVALERQSMRFALLAGLSVGLAWNTKYHGWLTLVVAAAAFIPFAWQSGMRIQSLVRPLYLGAIMTVTAAVCYLPWAILVQLRPGGYAELTEHHKRYLSLHWLRNLWTQIQMQMYLEGRLSRCSIFVALLCVVLVFGWRFRVTLKFLLILLLCASTVVIGGAGAAALLALLAVPKVFRKPASYPAWLVLTWLAVWLVMAPFYEPYPRLVLPFTIASYLLAGLWLATTVRQSQQELGRFPWRPTLALAGIVVAAFVNLNPSPFDPWRPSRSMPEIASALNAIVPPGSNLDVMGEPSLLFYLRLAGRTAVDDPFLGADDFRERSPLYLVIGFHAKTLPYLRDLLKEQRDRLVQVQTFPMDPIDLRLLDALDPYRARQFRAQRDDTFDLILYRVSASPPIP